MARTPRWKPEGLKDGVSVTNLAKWDYFDDYIRQKMLDFRHYIWRGQADANWKLEPLLDRILRKQGKLDDPTIRNEHLQRFKFSSRGRRGTNPPPMALENDWWALGQHYGLATPLLDWTSSPYVAAYFAFAGEDNSGADRRAVFGLSARSLEAKCREITKAWTRPERPPIVEFVRPLSDENSRLVSQGGLFTRSPDGVDIQTWVTEQWPTNDGYFRLLKLTVPNRDRSLALRSLNRMNINHLSLFPDLYGASKFTNLDLLIANY